MAQLPNSVRSADLPAQPADLTQLQDLLDKATQDASYWDAVCEGVAALFGATGALLPPSNPQVRGLWMGGSARMKEALVEYLAQGWNLRDPRESVLTLMFERGYGSDDDVYPDREEKAQIPIYRDFLRKWDFGNCLNIRLMTPNGFWPMTVHFANDHPPPNAADIALLKAIQPLFEDAAKRATEVAHRRIYEFSQFFSGTECEVCIFDADGKQYFRIDQSGRTKSQSNLETLIPQEISEEFRMELMDVLKSDPNKSLSKAYQFTQNGAAINVLVIQTPPSLRHFFMPFKSCAIRTVCSEDSHIKHSRLRDRFSLTESEINTVSLLASGKTPVAIADLMSLKPSSVRQRLKLIYSKVGVSGQVELISLYSKT